MLHIGLRTRPREFLDAHFPENVTLDALAEVAELNPFRLVRSFRTAIGMPPHAYLLHRRIRHAEHLLRRGVATAEVAAACGFADQSHLTRTFKQANGITPARFRAA